MLLKVPVFHKDMFEIEHGWIVLRDKGQCLSVVEPTSCRKMKFPLALFE